MNGIHDCGGMHGLGAINVEPNEPVFHADWERRMFAIQVLISAGGHFNSDQARWASNQMGAVRYLGASYYERMLYILETSTKANGSLAEDEID